MIENVCMKDCHFKVDKEKRTVVCWIGGTKNFFIDFLDNNATDELSVLTAWDPKFKMNNKFTGTAYCAVEDEWDEEIGKRLAFYRMKRKLFDSFYNKIRAYFDMMEKNLDLFEETCLAYRAKVEGSISRQVAKIAEMSGVDDYYIEGGAYGNKEN